jgi:hypothetical protein
MTRVALALALLLGCGSPPDAGLYRDAGGVGGAGGATVADGGDAEGGR